jgi:hypothetical protein
MILSFLIMFILQELTPFWWWILVVPFFNGLLRSRSGLRAFLAGMFSAGLLWFLASLHLYLTQAQVIATRINRMLGTPTPLSLVIITTLVGMVCGAFAGSSGYFLKAVWVKDSSKVVETSSPESQKGSGKVRK